MERCTRISHPFAFLGVTGEQGGWGRGDYNTKTFHARCRPSSDDRERIGEGLEVLERVVLRENEKV
ncbi:hypothetical protein E2C01_080831 [Portunus trituberculatus]|uniref:Uncharacterized protein n=1 Tax=Portunus trituberculatus TaxID=210409 RepID=A0A5B7IV21_PORTR|nr:hypothetical protein [Portunus trituberculatus]